MSHQIESLLSPFRSEPDMLSLLDTCVGRLLRRDGVDLAADKERLRHIADWLRAALANDEPWLQNVDEDGRPKKLLKFGSIDAIAREADKAMLKAAQKLRSVTLVEGDEELVEMLADGYYVVRLLTPAALDRESAQMQHCIGNGGYDQKLNDDFCTYLSLRDPQGKAHATLEIEEGTIIQLQGKQNKPPIRRYIDLIAPYIRANSLVVAVPASHLGHVIDVDGAWHPLDNLPDGLTVDRSLDLSNTEITALPQGLMVRGNLILSKTAITELPRGLRVNGYLCLNGTSIAKLPECLSVGGSLDLESTKITALPDGLIVFGSLYVNNTPIAALPDKLTVCGDLSLSKTTITQLPERLHVGRNLILNGTKITAFPDGLTVGEDIYLNSTNSTEITAFSDSIADDTVLCCADRRISAKELRRKLMEKRSISVADKNPKLSPGTAYTTM